MKGQLHFKNSFNPQIPDSIYLWLAVPLFFLTAILNTWAVAVIMRKERNGMNEMIIVDCIVKIICFALILITYASPFSVLGTKGVAKILCFLRSFPGTFFFTFNRLVPVGIVLFRYIMVCHPVSAVNYGGEKPLWRTIHHPYIQIHKYNLKKYTYTLEVERNPFGGQSSGLF